MTSDSKPTSLVGIGAEDRFDPQPISEPVRVSGLLALVLAVASSTAFLGLPLLILPVGAIVLGWVALRRCDGDPPLGTGAGRAALILAVGFGVFAVAVPWLRFATLAGQAKQFSRDYIRLVALQQDHLALELRKPPPQRLPAMMKISEFYEQNPAGVKAAENFRRHGLNRLIRQFDAEADWYVDQPIRVDHHYGREQVEVVWHAPSGDQRIRFFMEYQVDQDGVGQWHVAEFLPYRETIVAENVL